MVETPETATEPSRRSFFGWVAAAVGAAAAAVVAIPGAATVLDPLLRPGKGKGQWRKVAKRSQLGEVPLAVPVIGEEVDAWTRAPERKLGTVFLRVVDDEQVSALSAECPHLGCSITFEKEDNRYACPCHESFFTLDGEATVGPSPRGMDPLEVKVDGDDVSVRFVRFRTQIEEREEIG